MAGQRDEVAARADRLIDFAVDLPLLDFAVAAPVIVVVDAAGKPGLRAPRPDPASSSGLWIRLSNLAAVAGAVDPVEPARRGRSRR